MKKEKSNTTEKYQRILSVIHFDNFMLSSSDCHQNQIKSNQPTNNQTKNKQLPTN